MDRISETQAIMSVSGRMPSLFSPGDCFRSQKVEFAGIKLGVLIYPKGTDRGSEGVTQIYIKNYSEKARIFDVSVSLGDKDKRYTHLPLNKRRCKMIGEFAGPEKADGHSPLLIAEVALTTKRNKDESSELRDEMRQLGNEIKETILDMKKENSELRNEVLGLKMEVKRKNAALYNMSGAIELPDTSRSVCSWAQGLRALYRVAKS